MNEERLKDFCTEVTLSIIGILYGYVKNTAPFMSDDDFKISMDNFIELGENLEYVFYDEKDMTFYSVLVTKCLIGNMREVGTINHLYHLPKYAISADLSLQLEKDIKINKNTIAELLKSQRNMETGLRYYDEVKYSFKYTHFKDGELVEKLTPDDICAMLNISNLVDLCVRYLMFLKVSDTRRVIGINTIRDEFNRKIYLDNYDMMSINLMVQEFSNLIAEVFAYEVDAYNNHIVWAIPVVTCNLKYKDGKSIYEAGDLPVITYKALATIEYTNQ